MTRRLFFRLRLPFAALLALLFPICAAHAAPKVSGALSSSTASVGEAVEYELTIEGADAPDEIPALNVDGLQIQQMGQNRQLSIINGNVSNRLILTYSVVPKREGKFTIPAVEVRAGGQVLKTQPATLTVAPGEAVQETGDLAFAKISLAKKSLYVGEVAPMEVKFFLDASARWNLPKMPTLSGDGFTMRPFDKPAQRNVELGGKTYLVVTFKTVLTPGKAGKLNIGPMPAELSVSKPGNRRARRPDPFDDIFGRNFAPPQEITVTAPALEIEVKPLPFEGRPKDFSGAIGNFEFDASGTPQRVKAGEPVSMKLTIKGSGNFDRIGQPQLVKADGWQVYSAKEDFQGDSGATEGTKTFELPVTPLTANTMMPVFIFSYFDPEAEKYVTLKSASAPLVVEDAQPSATPTPAPLKTPDVPREQPKSAEQDILANLPDIGPASAAFAPSFSPAVFFSMMFAPVPLAVLFIAWRRRRNDSKLARITALKREKAALLAQVKSAAGRAEVLDAAVKAMRIHVQLENGAAPEDDASTLLKLRKVDAETEKVLRDIFEARTELLYAGVGRADDRIAETERDRVLDAVTTFERSAKR